MKYTKYILFVVAILMAACTIDEDLGKSNDSSKVRLVTRVVPFNQYDVNTRAEYGDMSESDITSLDYVIMADINKGEGDPNYKCIYYAHSTNSIITIDKDVDFADLVDKTLLEHCVVTVVANYGTINATISADALTAGLDYEAYIDQKIVYKGVASTANNYVPASYFTSMLQRVPQDLPLIGIPEKGLPRVGNYKDASGESIINFNELEGGNTYEVRLECLYAKMVFDITVDPTQHIVGEYGNTFTLDGYTVTNLATAVGMEGGTSSPEGKNSGIPSRNSEVHKESDGTTPLSITGAEGSINRQSLRNTRFVCYLPERYLPAKDPAETYTYPFLNGKPLRDEDKNLRQRYKPLLAPDNATYVTLNGTFVDHQGHSYSVSYKIYVGNDNYSNFDVVRNRQYNNYITIRGIDNANDQSSDATNGVAIDHRVDIQRSTPSIISLRRETFLDSHFEVRPIRIRKSDALDSAWNNKELAVKVEIIQADITGVDSKTTADWIGLERSYGNGVAKDAGYCNSDNNKSAKGKRLYFTTDLTTVDLASSAENVLIGDNGYSQKGGQFVIVPVTTDGECVWIYVDECDEDIPSDLARSEASFDKQATRKATIRITNGYLDGTSKDFKPLDENVYEDYILCQHKLFKLSYKGLDNVERTYYIEHEEEYLYNFDAEDTYNQNQTQFEGMPWGLENVQLSDTDDALFFVVEKADDSDWFAGLVNFIRSIIDGVIASTQKKVGLEPKYDFYIKKHDVNISSEIEPYEYNGWNFCNKIIAKIFPIGSENRLQLNQKPNSAIEYCYNRNKRDANGYVNPDSVNWYLPAIDEMEDIMMAGYSYFDVFQDKFYWSCQPAYIKHYGYADNIHISGGLGALISGSANGEFYMDDIGTYIIDANANTQTKNKGRARSTKIKYNPANASNPYENVLSGVNSYDNAFRIYEENVGAWYWPEYEGKLQIIPTGTYRNHSLYDWTKYVSTDETTHMKYDEGNKLRTDKCRVRAVRKMN